MIVMNKLKILSVFVFIVLCCPTVLAQDTTTDYFEYEDAEKTVIIGVIPAGWNKEVLTIPSQVTHVESDAFYYCTALTELAIDNANVSFDKDAFNNMPTKFASVNFGSKMSEGNMKSLVMALGKADVLSYQNLNDDDSYPTVLFIEGFDNVPDADIRWTYDEDAEEDSEEAEQNELCDILKEGLIVTLPATLVDSQIFGNAPIYGRFSIANSVSTTCVKATFQDIDNGSNMLFYIPTEIVNDSGEKKVHVQRVNYIIGEQGVLIHNAKNTSTYADLPRYEGSGMSYDNNMLVGTLQPTTIGKTDGEKTNLILYNGLFYVTSGGTLGANRAYLQIPTEELATASKLAIMMPEEEESISGIIAIHNSSTSKDSSSATPFTIDDNTPMYNLAGQRVNDSYKGIVVIQGRKEMKMK